MSKNILESNRQIFGDLLSQIKQARQKAFARVNTALIDLYWLVGKTISEQVKQEAWGIQDRLVLEPT